VVKRSVWLVVVALYGNLYVRAWDSLLCSQKCRGNIIQHYRRVHHTLSNPADHEVDIHIRVLRLELGAHSLICCPAGTGVWTGAGIGVTTDVATTDLSAARYHGEVRCGRACCAGVWHAHSDAECVVVAALEAAGSCGDGELAVSGRV
jgi:hypothetical protein